MSELLKSGYRVVFKRPYKRGTPRHVKKHQILFFEAECLFEALALALRDANDGWHLNTIHRLDRKPGFVPTSKCVPKWMIQNLESFAKRLPDKEAAERERDELRAELKSCSCAFCGESISNGGPGDRDRIRAHVSQCESHPLYAIIKERDTLKDRLEKVVGMLEPLDIGICPDCEGRGEFLCSGSPPSNVIEQPDGGYLLACELCGGHEDGRGSGVTQALLESLHDRAKAIAEGRDDE